MFFTQLLIKLDFYVLGNNRLGGQTLILDFTIM